MTNQLSSKTKRNIGIAAAAILTSALVIPTAIAARDYQEKLTKCEAAETEIVEFLNVELNTEKYIQSKFDAYEKMKAAAEASGIFGWGYYGPQMMSTLELIRKTQDNLDNLREADRQVAERYRNGTSCKLSDEYRKEQWQAKFIPIVNKMGELH